MVQVRTAEQATQHAVEARTSLRSKKFRNFTTAGKVMLMLFLDSEGLLSCHFMERGESVTSARYSESSVLNCVVPSKTSDLDVCVMVSFCYTTLRDHTQFGTPWTPFETCAERCSNIPLTARTCHLASSDFQQAQK
ncbi:hypothetical protein ANN_04107 [Periplaneta americana]|uniref:Uncharacterized protein n=1 Tax=Periplaneta americana TaxID=6978 RepID=A0ABQ8T9I8_PERAM|nr:hypothetical protein ANN_04107 [Periplaneta americana]